jgi:hypothetical protein
VDDPLVKKKNLIFRYQCNILAIHNRKKEMLKKIKPCESVFVFQWMHKKLLIRFCVKVSEEIERRNRKYIWWFIFVEF